MAKQAREWSAAGAARAARTARVETLEFLSAAPAAREWQTTKLQHAFLVRLQQTGDGTTAAAMMWAAMGYQPPFTTEWDAATERVVTDEARLLEIDDLYIVSPEMCDVVTAAAQALTADDLALVDEDDLPSLSGLVVLPHPLLIRALGGDPSDYRAFTWHRPAQVWSSHPQPAIRFSDYHDTHGPLRPKSFTEFADRAAARGTPLPPLMLDSIRCMPLHLPASADNEAAMQDYLAAAREQGRSLRKVNAELGHTADVETVGEYVSGATLTDHDGQFSLRWLFAFWRLCEQKIGLSEPAEVTHSAQKQADRAQVSPSVRVVCLRRRLSRLREGEPQHRDWSHRWLVRMHKVHQWYPRRGRHRVLYRGPYIKGPEDRPLLAGEVVQGLVR